MIFCLLRNLLKEKERKLSFGVNLINLIRNTCIRSLVIKRLHNYVLISFSWFNLDKTIIMLQC